MNFSKGKEDLVLLFRDQFKGSMMESGDFMNDHCGIVHFVVGF